ncbi:MAG: hypothetical protein SFV22_02500 [Saprospiraceae bacterium]|nr:hypothetical protein [Saprospiraceae bacterium]
MNDLKKPDADLLTRIIVLMYGILENGNSCWIYAAVKPSKYEAFIADQKLGKINVQEFEPYGEIIVSGEGKSPPDEITLKVAEMYQTDLSKIKQPDEIKEEVKKKTKPKGS